MEKPGTPHKKIARWILSGFDQVGFEAAPAGSLAIPGSWRRTPGEGLRRGRWCSVAEVPKRLYSDAVRMMRHHFSLT